MELAERKCILAVADAISLWPWKWTPLLPTRVGRNMGNGQLAQRFGATAIRRTALASGFWKTRKPAEKLAIVIDSAKSI
jgi:hypothetical protein